MRLQLHIQRNALPPVQIIHTTGTGPSSHTRSKESTIADLLSDVNEIVPLESADGEWGLEDYVVEVGGAGARPVEQQRGYECLHYQACESVLKEDDEVTIKPLGSEELRIRRLGGRHQITGDGRHLIDGVAFGKRWLRTVSRPGVMIPPRKRRRLLAAEEYEEEQEGVQAGRLIMPPGHEDYSHMLVPFMGDDEEWAEDEDEEEDDDYVGEEQEEEDGEDSDGRLQIAVREEFDDADVQSDGALESDGQNVEERDDRLLTDNDDLSEEVKLLLKDAADITNADSDDEAHTVLKKKLKRKRDVDDEGERYDDDMFEGFSTPGKSPGKSYLVELSADQEEGDDESDMDSFMEELAEEVAARLVDDEEDENDSNLESASGSDSSSSESEVDSKTETAASQDVRKSFLSDTQDEAEPDSDVTSDSESSSSESEADSLMDDITMEQAKKRALALINGLDDDEASNSEEDDDYVSTTELKEHEQPGEVDETEPSSTDSDSDSTTDSDSDSDSEDDDSDPESEESESEAESEKKGGQSQERSSKTNLPAATTAFHPTQLIQKRPTTAPGQGLRRTHVNNARTKKKKRLSLLKAEGLLPEDADFKALAEYEEALEDKSIGTELETMAPQRDHVPTEEKSQPSTDDVTMADEQVEDANQVQVSDKAEHTSELVADPIVTSSDTVTQTAQSKSEVVAEAAPKRARLDLASSRRMLFSSLGLRTPKTKEAEQALREMLSKAARPIKRVSSPANGITSASPQIQDTVENDVSWKDKLIVAAVECEGDGGVLDPPPFPFQQGWMKRSNGGNNKKRKLRDQEHFYQYKNDRSGGHDEEAYAPDVSMLNYDDEPTKTATNGTGASKPEIGLSKGIQMPSDFEALPALDQEHILPGAIIAYKELHVDATTNWQPEISTYRVGEVSQRDPDGTIHLILDGGCLKPASSAVQDEGPALKTRGFELSDDDADQTDDGRREIQISSMISGKLVKASSVEVPESSHTDGPGLRGGDGHPSSISDQFAVIPESAEQDIDTQSTPKPNITIEEIDTPSRQEISAIIKEAGFDSTLDEQLLQPITNNATQSRNSISQTEDSSQVQDEYAHRFRKKSPRINFVPSDDQPSSELGGEVSLNNADEVNATLDSDPPTASSPFIHTQETVEYPHISQMDINSSAAVRKNNSSSHQDAQKISPGPAVELSFTISEQEKPETGSEDDGAVSANREEDDKAIAEEAAENDEEAEDDDDADEDDEESDFVDDDHEDDIEDTGPSQQSVASLESEVPRSQSQEEPAGRTSFLGEIGHDGHDSSYHDDSDDSSDDDLPSLQELTSSQRGRVSTNRSRSKKLSPAARRKSLRNAEKAKSSSPQSSLELPPSSQPSVKLSQSQEPRLSQIPTGTPIVDLTFSSDIGSPQKDVDAFEDKARIKARVNGSRSSQSREARQVSGVGTKRFLTTKKTRNYF
ncbi:hypothetical protein H2202_001879 [Exophiala xenobiotica]|nr:hypothetical protein H2202_001879 [Exophiala xenobiotica]KAK5197923.1 hypothetical protein LTR92_002168 [Exophiala xenobiotica]KAK5210262.1 hypothetical protein LTR41_003930 [Exophiala xenobiotica]KAK5228524.1 hypothetical protein LTR72_002408 [Exophiala xenobiotica]KAK5238409.1 hypothetical protein LTR47_000152 [Exophiala xenobiotica]